MTRLAALIAGLVAAGLVQGCTPAGMDAPAPATASSSGTVTVVEVVDGDTIKVQNDRGDESTVRIIGIDTPETVNPRKPAQCYGEEASDTAAVWLLDEQVTLVPDPKTDKLDKYGRTLAYVEVRGGDYGLLMLEYGMAREYTYDRAYTRQTEYRAVEKKAKADREGLWGECPTAPPTTKPTPKAKPTPKPKPRPTKKRSVYYKNCDAVRAAGADPVYRGEPGYGRHLDRDGDGVGCE